MKNICTAFSNNSNLSTVLNRKSTLNKLTISCFIFKMISIEINPLLFNQKVILSKIYHKSWMEHSHC